MGSKLCLTCSSSITSFCSLHAAVARDGPGLVKEGSCAFCPLWSHLQFKELLARWVLGQLLQQYGFCSSPSSCFNSSSPLCFLR